MKKFLFVALSVLMIAAMLVVPASAQTISPWTTGIDIQNLTDTETSYQIDFYRADGSLAYTHTPAANLAARGSANVYLPSLPTMPTGQYNAVVSSVQLVAAVVSLNSYATSNPEFGGGDIYLGTGAPASNLIFPLVYRNHTARRWFSTLNVQNASANAQNITLNLYNSGQSAVTATKTVNIPGNGSYSFNLEDAEFAAFGPFGGATVSGSAELAGVAFNITKGRTTNAPANNYLDTMNTQYRAFTAAQVGQNAVLPLVYRNYNLWTTGINVVNNSGAPTDVTVTYTSANPAVPGTWNEMKTVPANGMEVFYTPDTVGLPDNFYGSATVASASANIAVVVASQRYRPTGAEGVAYEGVLPTAATACASLPVTHNRTTWKTGINLLNLGGSPATVTLNYYSSAPGIPNAGPTTVNIPANSPLTVYMPTDATTQLGFYGAVDVKSNQNILVNVANSRNDAQSHGVGSNYIGVNYTCP